MALAGSGQSVAACYAEPTDRLPLCPEEDDEEAVRSIEPPQRHLGLRRRTAFSLAAVGAGACAASWTLAQRGFARSSTLAEPSDSKVLVECGRYEENVSYLTKSPSSVVFPVRSAQACEEQCLSKGHVTSCGAWTWGKQRDVFGLTDVCLLQALQDGEKVRRHEKTGVVSGLLSGRGCGASNSSTTGATSSSSSSASSRKKSTTAAAATTTRVATTTTAVTTLATTSTVSEMVAASLCSLEEDIDFWTREALRMVFPVNSSEDCGRQCSLDLECGAWTWGKARDMPGATDTCFLKRMEVSARPVLHRKVGMVSGVSCAQHPEGIPPREGKADLFCFSLMLPHGYEVDLIKMQYDQHVSIFACDEWEVYSNEAIEISSGVTTGIVDSDLKCGKGGEFGTALNKEIFEAVWDSVVKDNRFSAHQWTAKADPDCVFFPDRMRSTLQNYPEDPAEGIYLNNCKFGMHGPLEVFSRNAVKAWHGGVQECESYFNDQCSGDCLWGEDMFIDQCLMRVIHVKRVDAFDFMVEDHCDPPEDWESCRSSSVAAFHPFKDEEGYLSCWMVAHALTE